MNKNDLPSASNPHRNATSDAARPAPTPAHLQVDDYEPAGFTRIERQRPSKRPQGSERERFDTRRQPREGKY